MMIFFSFLLSHRILPLHTMEYILGFGGEIAGLITQLIQEMKGQDLLDDYIEDQVTYELSQLCARVFLFEAISCRINTSMIRNYAILTYGANTIIDK